MGQWDNGTMGQQRERAEQTGKDWQRRATRHLRTVNWVLGLVPCRRYSGDDPSNLGCVREGGYVPYLVDHNYILHPLSTLAASGPWTRNRQSSCRGPCHLPIRWFAGCCPVGSPQKAHCVLCMYWICVWVGWCLSCSREQKQNQKAKETSSCSFSSSCRSFLQQRGLLLTSNTWGLPGRACFSAVTSSICQVVVGWGAGLTGSKVSGQTR
jgi:hypothetical protein